MINAVIVEDDPMVMEINRQYMNKIPGTRVLACFRNGKEAWEYLRNNPVELILLDCYMPEMTGLDLLKLLRSSGDLADVIMVTADNSLRDIKAAMSLGILDYLIKPFEFDRFKTAIERCLAKQALSTGAVDESQSLSQADIDSLLQGDNPSNKKIQNLDKGIQANTLETLLQCLEYIQEDDIDCEALASASHLSKVTVRRYMNYLIENDQAESVIDYSTGGRPAIRYRLKK